MVSNNFAAILGKIGEDYLEVLLRLEKFRITVLKDLNFHYSDAKR